ncbi:clavesin-1 like protein [Danaus plexippus plexippus]|uniref:Clavesin-1 like protein n=1 Tax=Danaus plexippus plexippus TaxID=278856 RepID=A0A212FBB1_DANPL|nr:clavesin-1 like protein [Danaus plexippus plexippus]
MSSPSDFRIERNVELSEETKEIAERELRETPERVREALERLRELLKENKDIYFGDEDEILTIFLRPCKWYPESALALGTFPAVRYNHVQRSVRMGTIGHAVIIVITKEPLDEASNDNQSDINGVILDPDPDIIPTYTNWMLIKQVIALRDPMRRAADFKRDNASLLDGLLPEHEKEAFLEHKVVNVMKGRDDKGRRVLIVNVGGSWNPKKVTADQLFRLFYLIHEAAMLEPESQVRGTVVIMDFHKMGMSQTMGLTPAFSKRLLTFIQDALPLRLKEVHFVKEPMIFNMVWKLFKPLIREKLKGRIFFHGSNMSSLHKHLAPSHLPADYDGVLGPIDYSGADWYPVVNEVLPHIQNWNSYGYVKKE